MIVLNALFDDKSGGAQKRVIEVGRELTDSYNVKTILLLPLGEGNVELEAKKAGLEVRRARYGRIPKPEKVWMLARWLILLPIDIVRIIAVIREVGVDIVHVNGAFFVAPAFAARFVGRTPCLAS